MKTIGLDISVLNDKQKSGIAVYNYNLIDNLLKINKKDKFTLFGIATFATYKFLKNLPFKDYPNVEFKIYSLSAHAFRTFFLLWQKLNWPFIENLIGSVDIFHSFNWYLPPQRKGKVVATVFDLTPQLFPSLHQPKTVQLEKVRLERIKERADLIITISKNSKADFLKFAPGKKIEVIYPGLSDNFNKKIDLKKTGAVLKKYNLKKGYILYLGTIEPRKNILFLINAFLKSNSQRKLVLVGKAGWESQQLFELIKKNKDKIITTGFIVDEDLPYIYSQACCFAYPSIYEGFGIPILEALSSSIPVICSNTSSLPEIGDDAVIYIDPKKLDSLVDAFKKIEDQKITTKLINKGLGQSRKFSWEDSARKLNFLYQQL